MRQTYKLGILSIILVSILFSSAAVAANNHRSVLQCGAPKHDGKVTITLKVYREGMSDPNGTEYVVGPVNITADMTAEQKAQAIAAAVNVAASLYINIAGIHNVAATSSGYGVQITNEGESQWGVQVKKIADSTGQTSQLHNIRDPNYPFPENFKNRRWGWRATFRAAPDVPIDPFPLNNPITINGPHETIPVIPPDPPGEIIILPPKNSPDDICDDLIGKVPGSERIIPPDGGCGVDLPKAKADDNWIGWGNQGEEGHEGLEIGFEEIYEDPWTEPVPASDRKTLIMVLAALCALGSIRINRKKGSGMISFSRDRS